VDCLGDICGLSKFVKHGVPDQWYRLLLAPFLHVGLMHLLLVLNVEMAVGYDMERAMGWWRFGGVFVCGSVGGCIFVPRPPPAPPPWLPFLVSVFMGGSLEGCVYIVFWGSPTPPQTFSQVQCRSHKLVFFFCRY
jgi:membrane associated rhomboid family serine protease